MMLILQGLKRLTHFDATGFIFFNASAKGFWWSFAAAFWCLPIWALAIYERLHPLDDEHRAVMLPVQAAAYCVAWGVYPLVVWWASALLGVRDNFYRYMVSYNWFRTVLQFIWLPILLLALVDGALSPGMLGIFWLVLQGVECVYDWFLARRGLGLHIGSAIALALIDLLLGTLIDQIADHIAGSPG